MLYGGLLIQGGDENAVQVNKDIMVKKRGGRSFTNTIRALDCPNGITRY